MFFLTRTNKGGQQLIKNRFKKMRGIGVILNLAIKRKWAQLKPEPYVLPYCNDCFVRPQNWAKRSGETRVSRAQSLGFL